MFASCNSSGFNICFPSNSTALNKSANRSLFRQNAFSIVSGFTLFCSSVRHLLLFCYYHYITYNVLQLNISPYQLSYVTNSGEDEGLLFYGSTIIPFKDKFDKTLKLYLLMPTKPEEVEARKQKEMEE